MNKVMSKVLDKALFIDEVIENNLILPAGSVIKRTYEVILPKGITKQDLYK